MPSDALFAAELRRARLDREALDRLHERARNRSRQHARVHLACAELALYQGRPKELGLQLWQAGLAPLASLLRRRAGLPPEDPGPGSLLATWRLGADRGKAN